MRVQALRVAIVLPVLVLGWSAAGRAASYSGTLAQPGVVWISDDSKPAPGAPTEMRNDQKAFVPDVVIVTVASAVRFPNVDPFFHSIYSESTADPFDIGFYDTGPGKLVTFAKPGAIDVRCHIHGSMHGTIVVVDGPWVQTHGPAERYTLSGVRPGNHLLHAWMPGSGETTLRVDVR